MAKVFQMAFELAGKLDASFKGSFQSANDTMSRTRREIRELRKEQKTLNDSFKQGVIGQELHTAGTANMTKRMNELTGVQGRMVAAQNMKSEAEAGKSKYGSMAVGAVGVGAAMFGPAIASAVEFESAMADVKKVVDFDTPDQFKAMGQDIMALSQRIPIAAEGLAAIVASGGQSGIARDELLSFAESAAKMGVAFDITADQAGDMMAKWRTAFKMNQEEVVDLADKINYLGNTTAASAPLISDVVRRIGPLGEIGGVASGEIAALGASMVGAGIESEVAATGIKNMILGLVAGEGATKSQAGAFAQLGLDATEMAKRMQTDAKGAILDVLTRIQGLEKYEQASVLKSLFGSESLSAIAPLLSNLGALEENLTKVADAANYTSSMEAEFAARSETTANALQLTKNSINAVATNLGTIFLPAISSAASSIAAVSNGLAAWAAKNPETAQTVATIAASVIGLVAGVGVLGYAFNFVKSGIAGAIMPLVSMHKWLFVTRDAVTSLSRAQATARMAQTAWTTAASAGRAVMNGTALSQMVTSFQSLTSVSRIAAIAQAALNVTMYGCPLVWIVGGVMAVVAAGYLLYKNWDMLKAGAASMAQAIGVKVDEIGEWFSTLPERIVESGSEMIAAAATWGQGIYDTVGMWMQTAADNVQNGWNIVCEFVGDSANLILDGAKGAFVAYVTFWTELPAHIAYGVGYAIGFLTTMPERVITVGTALIAATAAWGHGVYVTASTWAQNTVSAAGTWLLQLPGRIMTAGTAAIAATITWGQGVYTTASTWVQTTVNDAGAWIMQLPERVMAAGLAAINATILWGQSVYNTAVTWTIATIEGVAGWLMELPARSLEAGAALVASAEEWASGTYNAVSNWISQIPSLVSDTISNAGASISGWWDGVKANFNAGVAAGNAEGGKLPGHATGGIFSKPHIAWFAEGKDVEAAIPINRSARSVSLLEQTNNLMGNPLGVGGRGGISAVFNPVVNIQGKADDSIVNQVFAELARMKEEFIEQLSSIQQAPLQAERTRF